MSKLLDTVEGRWFVWWLINQTGFYNENFCGSSKDYYLKGCRAVGTAVHLKVREAANFAVFDRMENEELKRQAEYKEDMEV